MNSKPKIKPLRKVFGVILIIVGIIGLALPLVPFFILFPLGLEFLGLINFSSKIKELNKKENTEE